MYKPFYGHFPVRNVKFQISLHQNFRKITDPILYISNQKSIDLFGFIDNYLRNNAMNSSRNHLYILESLPEGDYKSGLRLFEDKIQPIVIDNPHIKASYQSILNKEKFYSILKAITIQIKENDIYPILHIECHGSESSIVLQNGEKINWNDICNYLVEINKACGLNLIVVLAACNGSSLVDVVVESMKEDKLAPFFWLIGPNKEITVGSIEKNFKCFYEILLKKTDWAAAIKSLNDNTEENISKNYAFYTIEEVFSKGYANYIAFYCRGKNKQSRIEALVTKAHKIPALRGSEISSLRKTIKYNLKPARIKKKFAMAKQIFFMETLFPENKNRFVINYKKIDEIIKKELL